MPPKKAVSRYRTSPALAKAKTELTKYKAKLSMARKQAAKAANTDMGKAVKCAAVTAGGGAIAGGVISYDGGKWSEIISGVDTRLLAGALFVLGGGYAKNEMGDIAVGLGAGMLASYASDTTADFLA